MEFTSTASVEQYLEQIPKFQSKGASAANFDLSRFRRFCDAIGNPQQDFSAVQVAGTNGKGSTCCMLGAIFREAGYKTGVYTSPHLINFRERFKVNDTYIPDDELIGFFRQYVDLIEKHRLTYFEITTAIAFWWFSRSEVDIAAIEVGLGGRLDATNIIDPVVSVITSISFDHTDILGDTIEEIAQEKGGIIKQGRPVVIGDLPQAARNIILQLAEQKNASVNTIETMDPTFLGDGRYQLTMDDEKVEIQTRLSAPVQANNMAAVWQVSRQLRNRFPVSREQFITALETVSVGFGRFERLLESQPWYFDGGHNVQAIQALKQSVQTIGSLDEATLILALMKDKLRSDLIAEFSEFKNIYYYQLNLERAATFDDINYWLPHAKSFPGNFNQQSPLKDFDSELVIFSGSFYFYEAVRDWVSNYAFNN